MPDHDVFLSYHWRDHAVVEALALRLRDAGLKVFLDRWYLTPGTNWVQALEGALTRCGAVAVCTGSEMGPWQQREAYSALERQVAADRQGQRFPVIPVLLPSSEAPLGFLSQNTWVDLRDRLDDPLRLTILAKAIRGEAPGPELQASIEHVTAAVCPYRGLLFFREEDATFFFGRETPTASLIEAVNRQDIVAVVGASGSGKSSLVRAGLVPALRRQRDVKWEVVTLFPGDRPLYNLAAALLPLLEPDLGEVAALLEIKRLAQALRDGNILLRDVVQRALLKQPGTQRLLLVVDQWEELFTLNEDVNDRLRFIDELLEATCNSPLSAVLTLRGDFFGRAVTSHRALSDRLQGSQVNLGPMQEDELRRAVVEPAKRLGLEFEPNLVELILEQALGEPGHLPLLEFVLRELWEKRQGRLMHRAAYDAMGQLEGAIAARAEALFAALTRNDPQAEQRIRSIVLRLVRPGEGEQDTRRRAALTDFDAPGVKLIQRLADDRLLVSSAPSTAEAPTVEVAHEALILHWDRLREWVHADRAFMAWRQRTGDQAQDWERLGRTGDLALRGLPLAQARAWLNRRRADLSDLECDFIRAGARRRNWFLASIAGTSIVSIAVVIYFAVAANAEQSRAELAREDAESLVEYLVFDLSNALGPVGRLDLMAGVNERIGAYYRRVGDAASQKSQRRRGIASVNQGNTLLAQGKLDAARKAYEQAQVIAERLAKADPSNTEWQRDLSVSYIGLGDVDEVSGRRDVARKAYEQAQVIRERLAKADPSNTEWQRDLSVSYSRLGGVEMAADKLDAARRAYEQGQAIAERLANADPSNNGWHRDLSVSYEEIGIVEMAAGKFDAARKAFEQAQAIRERLAKADPSNTRWQRELSVICRTLGDVEVAAGKLDAARQVYEQAQAIAERLAKADPSNTEWQRDLSVSYERLGDVEVAAGKLDAARQAYEQRQAIAERLAKADPSNTEWQRDLSVSYNRLGDLFSKQRKAGEALAMFERGAVIAERLATWDPANATWKNDLEWVKGRLASLRTGAKR